MTATLEKDILRVYDEKKRLIGELHNESNFKNAEIKIRGIIYHVSYDKRKIKISENDKVIYNLEIGSFLGNITIEETKRKVTGVFGLKWGTKMIDNENNTLIKIKNENHFTNTNKYEIKKLSEKVTDLDILISLYAHLYGSNKKLKSLLVAVISGVCLYNWL
jgi:hypothetical protein